MRRFICCLSISILFLFVQTSLAKSPDAPTSELDKWVIPNTPEKMHVVGFSDSIGVYWSTSTNATSYDIYRGTSSAPTTLIASGVTGNSYFDTGITKGQKYYYRVKAVSADGESDYTEEDVTTATEKGLTAVDFSQSGSYGFIESNYYFEYLNGVTIEAHVKFNSTSQSGMIFAQDDYYGMILLNIYYDQSKGKIRFETGDGNGGGTDGQSFSQTTIQAGRWYHIAASFSRDGDAKLYINGVEEASHTSAVPVTSDETDIGIGAYASGSTPADIKMDELRLWNAVRTETQIRENSNQRSVTGDHPDILALYHFDEGSGTTAHDDSQYGNNMVLNNTSYVEDEIYVPAAPTGLQASEDPYDPTIDLAWQPNQEADFQYYKVYMESSQTTPTNLWETTTEGDPSDTTSSISELSYGTYYFYVSAVDTTGLESEPAMVSYTLSDVSQPDKLLAFADSTSIELRWPQSSDAAFDHYKLYESTDYGQSYSNILTTSSGVLTDTSHTVTGLSDGDVRYYYLTYNSSNFESDSSVVRVVSVEADDGSAIKNTYDGYVEIQDAPPIYNRSFTIEFWAKRLMLASTEFMLSMEIDPEYGSGNEMTIGFKNITDFEFSFGNGDALTAEFAEYDTTWHHWAVVYDDQASEKRAYKDGKLIATQSGSGTFPGRGPLTLFGSSVIDNYRFTGELDEVRIWEGVRTQEELRTYAGTRLKGNESDSLQLLMHFDEGTERAMDASMYQRDGVFKNTLGYVDSRAFQPMVPRNANVTNDTSSVTVSWAPSEDLELKQYQVYRETEPVDLPTNLVHTTTADDRLDTTFTETVSLNTSYYYYVSAVDHKGATSYPTEQLEVYTYDNATPPPTPANLTGSKGINMITLNWNAVDVPNFKQYRVYQESSSTESPTNLVKTTTQGETTDTTVTLNDISGGQYYFYVTSINTSDIESSLSNELSIQPYDTLYQVLEPSLPSMRLSGISQHIWADIDNDGDKDLIIHYKESTSPTSAKIYRNDGTDFTELTGAGYTFAELTGSLHLTAFDYNHDGNIDLAMTGDYSEGIKAKIYENSGSGFTEKSGAGFDLNGAINGITHADLNSDGKRDLVVYGDTTKPGIFAGIGYLNTGEGFERVNSQPGFSFLNQEITAISFMDFDLDGREDAVLSLADEQIKFYRNTGNGFEQLTGMEYDVMNLKAAHFQWADWNLDGKPDLLMSGSQGGDTKLSLYTNTGSGFSQETGGPFYNTTFGVVRTHKLAIWYDYNTDGKPDIVLFDPSKSGTEMVIYENTGTGFQAVDDLRYSEVTGYYSGYISTVDWNNDGYPDLFINGHDQYGFSINQLIEHQGAEFNTNYRPSSPSGLTATFDKGVTTFQWDAGSDYENGTLAYNMRLGTASDSGDVIYPEVGINTMESGYGDPRTMNPANVGYSRSYKMNNLRLNTDYYWSVNAVDPVNRGSEFSSEVSFRIDRMKEISGPNEGWRFISAPTKNTTFAELLDSLWTQGATGADDSNGSPNVYEYYEGDGSSGVSERGFKAVTDLTDTMRVGQGYIVYVFADDDNDGEADPFPKQMMSNQFFDYDSVRYDFLTYSTNDTGDPDDGFQLVGNPYPDTLAWTSPNWERDQMYDTYYIWDANNNRYQTYTVGSGGVNGGTPYIPPYQGFWVQASGSNPTMKVDTSVIHQSVSEYQLKSPNNRKNTPLIFTVESEAGLSESTGISILADSLVRQLPASARQLEPLSQNYVMVHTNHEKAGAVDMYHVSSAIQDKQIIPLHVKSDHSGTLTLRWEGIERLPMGWTIQLKDKEADILLDLSEEWSYAFDYVAEAKSKQSGSDEQMNPMLMATQTQSEQDARFEVIISTGELTSIELPGSLPKQVELRQNYPNPFNPETNIRFGVPDQRHVQLMVYDINGREVARLVDRNMSAGWYNVRFNANHLASGVYFYRFVAGSDVKIKKLTLIK